MDLSKMDPMARKLKVHTDAFTKALEDGEENSAREHLAEILKFGNFLHDDLTEVVRKAEEGVHSPVNDKFSGSVMKFNETGSTFDTSQRDRQLPGTVISARNNGKMRPHTGTFGRAYRP
tara:strand:+ start:2223 stop:2579 length:357 start_codon:yes stop_codon:yes gene_type:complete